MTDTPQKRRRLAGACDACRQKKVRCDSAKMVGRICTNCIAFGLECTHVFASKGTVRGNRYVMKLNQGKDQKEHAISAIRAEVAEILSQRNDYIPPQDPIIIQQKIVDLASYARFLEQQLTSSRQPEYDTPVASTSAESDSSSMSFTISQQLSQSPVELKPNSLLSGVQERYYGIKSNYALIKNAMGLKAQYEKDDGIASPNPPTSYKRAEFWQVAQVPSEHPRGTLHFPDDALLHHLIDLFFLHQHLYFPIFHRPTFEKAVTEGLHTENYYFGAIVLTLCALGSRYSDDPRAKVDIKDEPGMVWFKQIQIFRTSYITPPTLFEVQLIIMAVQYLHTTASSEVAWTLIGIAIRYAQDVGRHTTLHANMPTAEDELWKRAYWALMCMDIFASLWLGRPRGIHSADVTLEYPIECDDEYWEHTSNGITFNQPKGKPSVIACWTKYIRLMEILSQAVNIIHSSYKNYQWLGDSPTIEANISPIEIALTEWVDSLPTHLQWDSNKTNETFFQQTTHLYTSYYLVILLIHRSLLPEEPQTVSISPSLSICANAARSLSYVLDVQSRRGTIMPPNSQLALFNATATMIINTWAGRHVRDSVELNQEMQNIRKSIDLLHQSETRWKVAGRFCDLLEQLVHTPNPLHQPTSFPSISAVRDDTHPRVDTRGYVWTQGQPTRLQALPVHTNELSRLPAYGLVDFSEIALPTLPNPSFSNEFMIHHQTPGDIDFRGIIHPHVNDAEYERNPLSTQSQWRSWNEASSSNDTLMHHSIRHSHSVESFGYNTDMRGP